MKKLFYFMLSLVAFVGCTESETDNTNNNQGGGKTEPSKTELTVNVTDLSFDAEADVKSIDISSSDAWTAEFVNDRASEWCSLSPTSGQAGNSSILVNVTENNSGEERSASIIIKAKSLQKIVKVTQKQNDALTVTASKFEVKAEGGEVEIEVKANVDYDYSIEESAKSWVTYKTTRAMESSTLVFDVAENSNIEKREAKITLKSGDIKEVVTIYQEGTECAIILSKNEYTVSDKGETIAVEVKSNVDVAVEISSDVDWVKENSTRAMSTNTYYFEVSPNEDYNSRSTAIKFTNKENNLAETVTITQAQKDAIVIAKDSYTVNYAGGEIDIEVGHNVDFDVEISHDWITTASTRAFETETLNFNIAANNSNDGREGTIKFISKDKAITHTVKVEQEARPTKPANNEIWYTSSSRVVPYDTKRFGVNIVSNTFANGIGVIKFDGDVTEIGYMAFRSCSSLTTITIPDSVTKIEDDAFYYCSNLTSITIPDSVTEIGDYSGPFTGCHRLKSANIIISNLASYCEHNVLGYRIGLQCDDLYLYLDNVEIKDLVIPEEVRKIGDRAFKSCCNLTSVTISDSVKQIGNEAFAFCDNLVSVTVGNSLENIADNAFYSCSSLTSFYGKYASADNQCLIIDGELKVCAPVGSTSCAIPDGVIKIGSRSFMGCSNLTNITIPDSVTEIGEQAFRDCSSLASILIPNSVTKIGHHAFIDCISLTSVTIPDGVTEVNYFSGCSSLSSVIIPDGVTKVGGFSGCSSLVNITIPDGVTEILDNAFAECSSLTSITIPDSVTEIGTSAFHDCSSLRSAIIGRNVKTIKESAFASCISLAEIICKPATPPLAYTRSGKWAAFDKIDSSAIIYVPIGSGKAYKSADRWNVYAYMIEEKDM